MSACSCEPTGSLYFEALEDGIPTPTRPTGFIAGIDCKEVTGTDNERMD